MLDFLVDIASAILEWVLRPVGWVLFFIIGAVLAPPVIFLCTALDGSAPFGRVFWRRYRYALFEVFSPF